MFWGRLGTVVQIMLLYSVRDNSRAISWFLMAHNVFELYPSPKANALMYVRTEPYIVWPQVFMDIIFPGYTVI